METGVVGRDGPVSALESEEGWRGRCWFGREGKGREDTQDTETLRHTRHKTQTLHYLICAAKVKLKVHFVVFVTQVTKEREEVGGSLEG